LYPGWDTFEFDQGHSTKNQPITMLILMSENMTKLMILIQAEGTNKKLFDWEK